jgi:prepilin signal peptidase PulO-like enzyme (type II secretory pathway)
MLRLASLIIGGVILGSLINWAIYAWAMFLKRPISPWMEPAEGESPRTAFDRIPIIGWFGRRRDSKVYGNGFWVRPMLIEIACAALVPWLYFWLAEGGLTGGVTQDLSLTENIANGTWSTLTSVWFWGLGILLTLICIGTFIDFDEKTIPDEVTVTGTIAALLLAAFAPMFRLPEVASPMGGKTVLLIDYASPNDNPGWHLGVWAMVTAMAIFAIWIWALLPKLPVWYVGLRKSTRFMFAHAFQPKRKTKCELRIKTRSTPGATIFLCGLLVVGIAAIAAAWTFFDPAKENLNSLYSAFLGMAFGGGLVWAIRIVGTLAMGQEAMGFGDVTLHAMIGAFLGWQAALLIFVMAPFAALLVVFLQFVFTRQNVIAFGPYLSVGTVILLYFWNSIWPGAANGVFRLGPFLLVILVACLVLLAVMLGGLAWIKGHFGEEEIGESNA